MRLARWLVGGATTAAAALQTLPARALDVGSVAGQPAQVDVTETTIVGQRFDARGNEQPQDSGWGAWTNRIDGDLRYGAWTAGLRLDSVVYWRRPVDNRDFATLPPGTQNQVVLDGQSRFQNALYPAKLWLTYAAPGVEVTAGDAYVQFGRGLTLSMRKIDELGVDTTLRGIKVQAQRDPFAVTAVAGFGNPSRIDEATGRNMWLTTASPSLPMFGSDRIAGIEVQAGRGLPITLATRAVQVARCAPYHYAPGGGVVSNFFEDPAGATFGSCSDSDVSTWLASLPDLPLVRDRTITMVGQSLELPSLGGHGKLYVEVAAQQRQSGVPVAATATNETGNALYAAAAGDVGPFTGTLEIKSNRNYYPVPIGANFTSAPEFNVVAYSFVPPAETPTLIDAELNSFNACVNAGRLRGDVRVDASWLVYGQGVFADTRSEQTNGRCDAQGHTLSFLPTAQVEDQVWDGLFGVEWMAADHLSHAFVSLGVRDDTTVAGGLGYRERHAEYSLVKYVGHAMSVEMQGFHRWRKELDQNTVGGAETWWNEGENYLAFKVAPAWVFTQGFEYTSRIGQPTTYFNGSVLYKLTSASNVRVFVGQQRGAFRCSSGVCRYFPPYEGARAELTWRF